MKTAHRRASHAKRELPKFWQPTITADQVATCQLAHWDLIDRFTGGRATQGDLLDWIETGLTYSELMRLLEADGTPFTEEAKAAIAEQLECYEAVLQRFHTSGRVGFNGAQLLTARAAAEVMDQLIEMDRFGFAVRAAEWSNAQMARLQLSKGTT
ncbi:hypothetical protein [Hydrogenophaga sp. 2FB]|uniref:hypothetical protein n=1 Tax=Hydrogenophaga sp. 2FB TaxID=2502187 RepID=UPI0010F8A453|nr:hypothetical protein [Hydrogenophaga sp. 2FB]